jgi:ABC-type transport system involved in multi-copper enzyme maturation permease subunit
LPRSEAFAATLGCEPDDPINPERVAESGGHIMADVAIGLERTIGNTVPLKTLLWKEYRQNRMIVYIMFGLLLLPYPIVLGVFIFNPPTPPEGVSQIHLIFPMVTLYGIFLAQLVMALIGGNLIAGERVDRSVEFFDSLPIPRGKSLLAKLLLVAAMVVVIWLPNSVILWSFVGPWLFNDPKLLHDLAETMWLIAATGLTLFCVAWFFSSLIKSPVLAVCGSIVVPVVGFWSPVFFAYLSNGSYSDTATQTAWYLKICLVSSVFCFLTGTWVYLRRVEP